MPGPGWPAASPTGLGRPAQVAPAAVPAALPMATARDLLPGTAPDSDPIQLREGSRAILAASLLLVGTTLDWADAATALGAHIEAETSSQAWSRWQADGSIEALLDRLCGLADHLASRPPPVDHARRRRLWPAAPRVAPWAFNAYAREHQVIRSPRARRWSAALVWELLTGTPAGLATDRSGLTGSGDATNYRAWRDALPPARLAWHHESAERHLLAHRIDEPVSSHPRVAAGGTWTDVEGPPRVLGGWNTPSRASTLRQSSRTPGGPTPEDLGRFAVLAHWPTATLASQATGIPTGMLTAALRRLERAEGASLAERAERGRPQALTPAGRTLAIHAHRTGAP